MIWSHPSQDPNATVVVKVDVVVVVIVVVIVPVDIVVNPVVCVWFFPEEMIFKIKFEARECCESFHCVRHTIPFLDTSGFKVKFRFNIPCVWKNKLQLIVLINCEEISDIILHVTMGNFPHKDSFSVCYMLFERKYVM